METVQSKRIFFDAEDRPPASYWNNDIIEEFKQQYNCNASSLLTENGEMYKNQLATKIDPQEWLKAPEFVPRSKKQYLADSFHHNHLPIAIQMGGNIIDRRRMLSVQGPLHSMHGIRPVHPTTTPFASTCSTIHMPQPILPTQSILPHHLGPSATIATVTAAPPPYFISAPSAAMLRYPLSAINPNAFALNGALGMVLPGYSANITHINSGIGPPIAAVILKKRRRKRHRRHKTNIIDSIEKSITMGVYNESDENSSRELPKSQLQSSTSEPNLNKNSLSEELSIERSNSGDMHPFGGSCPDISDSQLMLWDNYLFEAVVNDSNQPDKFGRKKQRACSEIMQHTENQSIDDSLSEDGLLKNLRENLENRFLDSSTSTTESLKAEFEQLSFKPTTQYGFPQENFSRVQVAAFNPEYNTVSSSILNFKLHNKANYVEEDFFEGLHVQLNAFDDADDHALPEQEILQLSRFQQIQWALQQNAKYYMRLATPDNTCCNIM